MGMSKDINDMMKEISSFIRVLQKGYHKGGFDKRLSNAKQGISNKNKKANDKFNEYWKKIRTWISKEMKK